MYTRKVEIRIDEAICDACGVIGKPLYQLHYGTGQRIGGSSNYCLACAEERRDELLE